MNISPSGSRVLPRAPDEGALRQALQCGRSCGCKRPRGKVHCPLHDASATGKPDLDVTTKGGTVLVVCRVSCNQAAIISELQALDLWPRAADVVRFPATSRSERKVRAPAQKLIRERRWPITNIDGALQAEHHRQDFEDGTKDCPWYLPGAEHPGLKGRKPTSLPLYRSEILNGLPDGATVVWHEGEPATDAGVQLGLYSVGTVTGAKTIPDDDVLRHLVRFDLVGWADHDDDGYSHRRKIAERVHALGGRVRMLTWPGASQKGDDAADFLERGGTLEQAAQLVAEAAVFDPIAERLAKLPIINAVDLAAKKFSASKVIVPGLLVEGATMLVAPGKSGKSRLMMAVGVGVAHGGYVLGSIAVEGGSVLYLALEDGERRGQARMLDASRGSPPPRLDMGFTWPTMDAGGLDLIEDWLRSKPDARLVVVDTLKRFRARTNGQRNAYDEDYEALAPLNDLALRYGVCIVIVHHTNKIRLSDDPTDRASGSTGLLAAVDGMIVVERTRGQADAILNVFHRDLEDAKIAIKSDPELGWKFLGDAAEYARTELQDEIVAAILEAGRPLRPGDIATALDRDRKLTGTAMWKMTRPNSNGLTILVSRGGYYWPASHPWPEPPNDDDDENLGNRGNPGNPGNPGNRGNRNDQGELFHGDGPVSQPVETQETGLVAADQEGAGPPVSPVSPVPPVRQVWRCACGCYERQQQNDGHLHCLKCGTIAEDDDEVPW